MLSEIGRLRQQLLDELVERAYAELGDVPLSQEDQDILVAECVALVDAATYPPLAPLDPPPGCGPGTV